MKSCKVVKRIAVVGTHGAGKSTLSYHLTSLLKQSNPVKSVICLEENVRNVAKLVNGDLKCYDFTKLAFHEQVCREIKASLLYDIMVVDRTLLDYAIYGKLNKNVGFLEEAGLQLFCFNKIYFLRPDKNDSPIANDGFRDTNLDFRNKVDNEFEKFFLERKEFHPIEIKTSEIFNHDYLKDLQ